MRFLRGAFEVSQLNAGPEDKELDDFIIYLKKDAMFYRDNFAPRDLPLSTTVISGHGRRQTAYINC